MKAFNHLPSKLLGEDPRTLGGRRVLFFAGADASAKAEVAADPELAYRGFREIFLPHVDARP